MMREILFRGRRKGCGEWCYGFLTLREFEAPAIFVASKERLEYCKGFGIAYCVEPETIGQFTGRRDKNCKMVFEHDILQLYRVWENGTVDKYAVAVVLFSTHDQAYVLCCGNDLNVRYDDFGNYGNPEYYEVIGNVHDNLELLEGV